MALWSDIIDPATLTGYARRSFADYESAQGSLARWLPNRDVNDISVRFNVTQHGLIESALFRAFDAEPEIGKTEGGRRVTVELPALGQNIPVSELDQIRQRGASDEAQVRAIADTTDRVVRSVADAIEYLRGVALLTGKTTINQDRFKSDDDWGRTGDHSVTASTLWSDKSADRLADLQAWSDVYESTNGEMPGAIVMSRPVFRAFANGDQFQQQLVGGGTRRQSDAAVIADAEGQGFPTIYVVNRRVSVNRTPTYVLGQDKLLMLPAPVGDDQFSGSQLGGTFWGRTLTADNPDWGIADSDAPGIVAGVYRNEKPPMIAEVISDAIALPVLANANLSLVADVL